MGNFGQIDVTGAKKLMVERNAVLVDVRDAGSFAVSHAESAMRLSNETLASFINDVDFDIPVLVMCYHGYSSQGAAQYLVSQGYEEVYNITGGFSAWHLAGLPTQRG